jgi:hypothetical protein
MAKSRYAPPQPAATDKSVQRPTETHDLDYGQIDDLDEIDEYRQQAFVWCNTHRKYEWHWVGLRLITGHPEE